MSHNDFILTLSCPDARGVVYRVAAFLFERGCNILDSAQFGDEETGLFFMRVHFDAPTSLEAAALAAAFASLAGEHQMRFEIHPAQRRAKTLVLVSRQGHCLNDLLFRVQTQQLPIEVVGVVSNHRDFEGLVQHHGLEFHHLPVAPDTRDAQESQILGLVDALGVELVVLARYMQILSPRLCEALAGRAINIHHSFLPSFKGGRPYAQAHARGVKLIGATAHYVTTDLDEGPIIEQDVERVDHTETPVHLAQRGEDIESRVLARAVRWHAERRILLNGAKTVVFR